MVCVCVCVRQTLEPDRTVSKSRLCYAINKLISKLLDITSLPLKRKRFVKIEIKIIHCKGSAAGLETQASP